MFHILRQYFYMRRNFIKKLDTKIIIGTFLYVVKFDNGWYIYSFIYCWYYESQEFNLLWSLLLTTDEKSENKFCDRKVEFLIC